VLDGIASSFEFTISDLLIISRGGLITVTRCLITIARGLITVAQRLLVITEPRRRVRELVDGSSFFSWRLRSASIARRSFR